MQRNATQALHDKRIAKLEATWREQEGTTGRPYDGPVPAEMVEQWETEAWQPPEPFKKFRHLEGGMRYDPGWAVVSSLEDFDERPEPPPRHRFSAATSSPLTSSAPPPTPPKKRSR